ncbi:MAG: right-handed parallel beta-helix repeat-containing protein [Thermoplasmata archaeon]|nr:right-handed parallel beta-helix repeat-containing protein [Thermoplasmata archaeon]
MTRGGTALIASLAVMAMAISIAAVIVGVRGATIVVDDDDGPWSDATSIGEGLGMASDGDTVRVFAGVYREMVEVNITVELAGNGTNSTIIDGEYGGNVVVIRADGAIISGFRVRNSKGDGSRAILVTQADDVRVHDNTLVWSSCGLLVFDSRGPEILRNAIDDNSEHGLRLDSVADATVLDNFISENGVGVRCRRVDGLTLERNAVRYSMDDGLALEDDSRNCSVRYNDVLFNGDGILLASGTSNSRVSWNNVSRNTGFGIGVNGASHTIVRGNEMIGNGAQGIVMSAADNISFVRNNVTRNRAHGAHLTNCRDAVFVNNRFIDNNGTNAPQAWDGGSGAANEWSGTRRGNHWSDHNGTDADGDGILDAAHLLGGGKGSVDQFPLADRWTPVAAIEAIEPRSARVGKVIFFTGGGRDPFGELADFTWRSSIDGLLHRGSWSNHSTDDLSAGRHIVTFRSWNSTGNSSIPSRMAVRLMVPPAIADATASPSPVADGGAVNLSADAVDPDGQVTMYVWNSSLDGSIYSGPWPAINVDGLTAGSHEMTLVVKDDDGLWSPPATATLRVSQRPKVTIIDIDPNPDTGYVNISFVGNATDDDALSLYSWSSSVDGEFHNDTEASVSFGGLSPGSHVISFRAMDTLGFWSRPAERALLISKRPRAYLNVTAPEPLLEGHAITFECTGFDPEGDLSWIYLGSSQDGELHRGVGNAVLNLTLSPGSHTVSLVVQDEHALLSDPFEVVVLVRRRLPDIAVANMSLHSAPVLGEANVLDVTLVNRGFVNASDVTVEFRAGSRTRFVVTDVPLSGETVVMFDWTPAAAYNVTLTIGAEVIGGDLVPGSNFLELRVLVAIPPTPLPDLVIDAISFEGTPMTYIPVNVSLNVSNAGSVAAEDVAFDISIVGGPRVGRALADSIPAGGSATLVVRWTPFDEGAFEVRAIADPDGDVEEVLEYNNDRTAQVVVVYTPVVDLRVELDDVDIILLEGSRPGDLTARIAIRLWGNVLPLDGVLVRTSVDGAVIDERTFEMADAVRHFQVPMSISFGDHVLVVEIDPEGDLQDVDRNNNVVIKGFYVERPLTDEAPVTPPTVYATVAFIIAATMALLAVLTRSPERPNV